MIDSFFLAEPETRYRKAALAMVQDFHRFGEDRYPRLRDLGALAFGIYVRELKDAARGIGLRPGWVPYTTLWMITPEASLVYGTVQLRHWLTASLEKEGGHIGYAITPSQRGKGYGTKQLALALDEVHKRYAMLALDRVLITCNSDNIASARVIQKNGGVFENEIISDLSGKPVSRYWVDLM